MDSSAETKALDEAAIRVLHQLTGMHDIYMEQLYCFSEVDRDTEGRVIFSSLLRAHQHCRLQRATSARIMKRVGLR